jgi:hypothetical protein
MKTRFVSFFVAFFFSVILAACGGGGGGDSSSNNNQPQSSGFVLTPLKTWNFSGTQKDLAYTKDPFQSQVYHTTLLSCPPNNSGCTESNNFYQSIVTTTMEGEKVVFGDSGKSLEVDITRYGLIKDFSGCTYSNVSGESFILPLFPDIPILQGSDFTSPGKSVSGIFQTCGQEKKEVSLNFRLFYRDDGIQTVIDVVPVGSAVRSQQHTITRYPGNRHTNVSLYDYGKMTYYVRTQ